MTSIRALKWWLFRQRKPSRDSQHASFVYTLPSFLTSKPLHAAPSNCKANKVASQSVISWDWTGSGLLKFSVAGPFMFIYISQTACPNKARSRQQMTYCLTYHCQFMVASSPALSPPSSNFHLFLSLLRLLSLEGSSREVILASATLLLLPDSCFVHEKSEESVFSLQWDYVTWLKPGNGGERCDSHRYCDKDENKVRYKNPSQDSLALICNA